jgi:RNA polymerase sigma factor (sigma-70 family)
MTALPDWDIVSDAELACAAAAGDRGAFASIYDRYADRLHDFCVGMLRDRDAAADCVQDVFCTAADRLSQLREADKLRPWLYAIARNECLRCIRARGRERVFDEVPEVESAEPGPDTMAARSELANLIAEAAGGLSDRDREVLELAYRHGLDGPELAEALGVSANNAKKMAQRLRETIERSLGALLVSRQVRTNPSACPELREMLDGWDGQFTVLTRKRIARHIESCAVCDEQRRRMVSPVALLGGVPVFIGAPQWLRGRTLDTIQLSPAAQARTSAPDDDVTDVIAPDHSEGGSTLLSRRPALPLALFVAVLIALIGLGIAVVHHYTGRVAPANVTHTAPPPAPAPHVVAPSETTQPASPPTQGPVTTTIPAVTTVPPAVPTVAPSPPVATTVPAVPPPRGSGPSSGTSTAPVFAPPTAEPTRAPVTTSQPVTQAPPSASTPPPPPPSSGPKPRPPISRSPGGPVKPPPTSQAPVIF